MVASVFHVFQVLKVGLVDSLLARIGSPSSGGLSGWLTLWFNAMQQPAAPVEGCNGSIEDATSQSGTKQKVGIHWDAHFWGGGQWVRRCLEGRGEVLGTVSPLKFDHLQDVCQLYTLEAKTLSSQTCHRFLRGSDEREHDDRDIEHEEDDKTMIHLHASERTGCPAQRLGAGSSFLVIHMLLRPSHCL